jgi:hypothetical protein
MVVFSFIQDMKSYQMTTQHTFLVKKYLSIGGYHQVSRMLNDLVTNTDFLHIVEF